MCSLFAQKSLQNNSFAPTSRSKGAKLKLGWRKKKEKKKELNIVDWNGQKKGTARVNKCWTKISSK
jgi:hypothetical protein